MSLSKNDGIITRPAYVSRPVPLITYNASFDNLLAHHLGADSTYPNLKRIYVLASTTLAKTHPEHIDKLHRVLGPKLLGIRTGLLSQTHWNDLLSIAQTLHPLNVDCIITLGSGTLTDAAKILAWMLSNSVVDDIGLESMWTGSPTQNHAFLDQIPRIVTIAIPTTLSGGEYQRTASALRNDGSERKCSFSPPEENPALVILDPELAATTPGSLFLSTGVRAIDHCVETLCSPHSNDGADASARAGLERLVDGLLRIKRDVSDLEARFKCQLGVVDAMNAVVMRVPMGASHAISHDMGPLGVSRTDASCIFLPAVCEWNARCLRDSINEDDSAEGNLHRQTICRQILLNLDLVRKIVEGSKARQDLDLSLGDLLRLIIDDLGMPRSLRDVGFSESAKLEQFAVATLDHPWAKTNPIPLVSKNQVLEIISMVMD